MIALFLALALSAPLTIEDYATMPSVSEPQFSPDGRRIAYVLTRADLERSVYDSDVWLIGADGTDNRQLTRGPETDNSPRWSPDGKRIAFLSDREGRTAIYILDVAGGEAAKLTSEPTPIRSFDWSPDGRSIAFLRLDEISAEVERKIRERDDARVVGENSRHVHLYTIDVDSRAVRRLTRGDFSIFRFSWSPDGKTLAFDHGPGTGLDHLYRTDIDLVSASGGERRPLVRRPGLDRGPVFSPDGKSVAFTSCGGVHDWVCEHLLTTVSISDGTIRTIGGEYGRIPDHWLWSPDSKTIWFDGPLDSTSQIFRVASDGSRFTNVSNVRGAISDLAVVGSRAAFIYESLTEPPELHVSELARFAPRRLTHHAADFRNHTLGETRLIRWKNPKDGVEIEGFLTLPIDYVPGRRVPLLTFVHGGPASRFSQEFLGYLSYIYPAHVFAARGFAVLRPNPRGTGGYGISFRRANLSGWAEMPWLDITAGIDALIEQGIADPDRLGLMGWSYGGYMTAWAIGHGGERFQAISVGAPVVDLLSFHGTADIRDFIPGYFEGRRFDVWRAQSPLWHLKKIDAPVLIQHGEADERVPLSQGTMLYRILQELGVDVTMVVYPRTPHTPREPKLRIDVMRRNVEFFDREINAGTAPRSSPDR